MLTREAIIAEVRSYIGTPMNHRGRLKGKGIDCIGLVLGVAITFGVATPQEDDHTYPPDPPKGLLLKRLRQKFHEVDPKLAQLGDIACFEVLGDTCHCGFLTDYGLVHVFGTAGKVVEHGLAGTPWERRMTAAFRFPGVI